MFKYFSLELPSMIDFTWEGQIKSRDKKEQPAVLTKNDINEKLFVLEQMRGVTSESTHREEERFSRYLLIDTVFITAIITYFSAILPSLIPSVIVGLTNINQAAPPDYLHFSEFLSLIVFIAILRSWESDAIRTYAERGSLSSGLWISGRIPDLFSKIKEKWYVYSNVSDSYGLLSFWAITEKDKKKNENYEKERSKDVMKQVKDVKSNQTINDVFSGRDQLKNKKVSLKGLLEWNGFFRLSNGFYYNYKLWDKTGSITCLAFYVKKHFWNRTPNEKNQRTTPKGIYGIEGTLVENNGLFYIAIHKFIRYMETKPKEEKSSGMSKIIKSWPKKQYLLFFIIIPLILALIYLLPQGIKDSYFIMNVKDPSITSIFLSNYTHSDLFNHLLPNVIIYLLTIFLIFNIETRKEVFYRTSFLILILLPVLSSLLTIYLMPSIPPVQGFSAIVAGFLGYFIYCTYNYIKNSFNLDIKKRFIWLIFIINLVLTTFSINKFFFVASVILSIILLYIERKDVIAVVHKILSKGAEALRTARINPLGNYYRMMIGMISMIFLFQLPLLVTSEVITKFGIINTPAHYWGYIFGLVIPLLIEKKMTQR